MRKKRTIVNKKRWLPPHAFGLKRIRNLDSHSQESEFEPQSSLCMNSSAHRLKPSPVRNIKLGNVKDAMVLQNHCQEVSVSADVNVPCGPQLFSQHGVAPLHRLQLRLESHGWMVPPTHMSQVQCFKQSLQSLGFHLHTA